MINEILIQGRQEKTIRAIDFHLGLFMEKLHRQSGFGSSCPELRLATTLTSMAVGGGHVCLPLKYAQRVLPAVAELIPALEEWRKKLFATPLVARPGEIAPLLLDEKNRLYFYRYYKYEEIIAEKLGRRAEKGLEYDPARAASLLSSLFPGSGREDEQKNAVALALQKPLVIISGGPGTGKTHTVVRILAAIMELNNKKDKKNGKPLRVGLTAPTGKAAARLEESIRKAKETIPASITIKEKIPEHAQTLHRLLGYQPARATFRYNAANLLHLDLIVLDEASMIDVVLMAALVEALPEKTRIILLGDHNQLTSVEAGNLFGDLCFRSQRTEDRRQKVEELGQGGYLPFSDRNPVIRLKKTYRFHEKSGIGLLAKAVNDGDLIRTEQIFASGFADIDYKIPVSYSQNRQWLRGQIINGYAAMVSASSLADGFQVMEEFRILCAVRRGSSGSEEINLLAEKALQERGYIPFGAALYKGKPIIIRKNNYGLQLFNGDTGLLWPDGQGQLMAWFKREDNRFLPVTPARLPEHDSGFAITIHKAQGSEFARVLLILPEDESRVLSRELLYTGITRARNKLLLMSRLDILAKAIMRRSERYSGFQDRISAFLGWQ